MPEPVARRPTRTASLNPPGDATASARAPSPASAAFAQHPSSTTSDHDYQTAMPAEPGNAAPSPIAPSDKENIVPITSQLSNPLYDRYADDRSLMHSATGASLGALGYPSARKSRSDRRSDGLSETPTGGKSRAAFFGNQQRSQWPSSRGHSANRNAGDQGSNAVGGSKLRGSTGISASLSPTRHPGRIDNAGEEGFFDHDFGGSRKGGWFGHSYSSEDVYDDIDSENLKGTSGNISAWPLDGPTRRNPSISRNILAGLTLAAMAVRLFRISMPTSVVFDEVHFGGFASKYIKGEFFMDVHPPLGKLLIALAGLAAGFDGQFDFNAVGTDYPVPKVPYVAMRMMPAVMGIALPPIAYLTARQSGCSTQASIFASIVILLENGLTTQSRHILLDSSLLFFIALAVLMWLNFRRCRHNAFSLEWWFWLTGTGVALGSAVSIKWVGLFLIALIGFYTIKELWDLFGDVKVKLITIAHHSMARVLCLLVLPVLIYMFFFQVHFLVLPSAGDGSGFMSTEFQQTLRGVHTPSTAADIAYGSKVFIRHVATNGGYLHSHPHNYQTGSRQQQVTLYPHFDENSYFLIKKKRGKPMNSTELEWVMNGDVIRLEHVTTLRHLHSHDHRPPVTDNENHNEVSAYGAENFEGDSNDYWRVEILESNPRDPKSANRLRAIHSKFRLVHVNTHCHLFSHAVKLPDYAFGQQEVTCMKNCKKAKALWMIVENVNDKLPENTEVVRFELPGFFGKFIELNKVMWNTNKGLTDSHPYESKPITWPFLLRGISFWAKDQRQIYLLGNPLVWWSTTASVAVFALAKLVFVFRKQRGYRDDLEIRARYEPMMGFFCAGWFVHYAPFFLMSRQLFVHHYFPALYFAILASACLFDLATSRLRQVTRWAALATLSVLLFYVFLHLSFLTYGLPTTKTTCERRKWLSTWDFDCHVFPLNVASGGGAALPVIPSP